MVNDTPLRCRIPAWMADGLAEVARKQRVESTSLVTRWAIEDMLRQHGITQPTAAEADTAAA